MKKIDIATIYYDKNYKIKSTNSIFQNEFNETLNLNFDEICLERAYYFEEELEVVQELALEMGLSQIEAYKKAIASVNSRTPEYSGFFIFKFRELIEFY